MSEQFHYDLEELRREFDGLDRRLVELLNERAGLSLRVGQLKQGAEASVFMPTREAEVYANAQRWNQGPLKAEHIRALYREILASSRDLQRRPRIGYLGPAGTFTNQAALEFFGSSSEFVPQANFAEIFAAVHSGRVDCGVVPVENSTEGPVQENLDLLAEGEARVCGEITLPIAQYLMARCPIDQVKVVYSHPQAAAQCRRWLAEHLPGREVRHLTSTSRAAEQAASEPGTAAIAPRLAADIYNLDVLVENIQDLSSNYTRFFVISTQVGSTPSGRDKTAICLSIRDRVGALRDVVQIFAEAGLNLSSIQSRPSKRRPWEYLFIIELDGHADEPRVAKALAEVEQHAVFLKVLGAWPVPA
jgi:chorismate mutase/prephenate dehydratase